MALLRNLFVIACVLLSTSAPLRAQEPACNPDGSNAELIACAAEDYDKADAQLNAVYGKLRADLDEQGRSVLRDAQRAWIGFRDAECRRQADEFRGGSIAPLIETACLADLTTARTTVLRTDPMTGETRY